MEKSEITDYIENLEYENKRMGDFLYKLGYTPEAITDIIINSNDVITKTKVYEIVRVTMNELEKVNDEVQAMRDKLYEFLDEHYDLSKFKPLHHL